MKRVWLPGLAGLMALALLAGSSYSADQPTTTKEKQPTTTNKADKHKHTANKPVAAGAAMTADQTKQAAKTHLPPNFAKANLTPEQHQKALAVMSKYAGQIKALDAQIHALRAQRDGELTALLTDAQKKSLADAKAASQKARVEKKVAANTTATATTATTTTKVVAEGKGGFTVDQAVLQRLHDSATKVREEQAKNVKVNTGTRGAMLRKLKHDQAKKEESKEQPKQQPAEPEKTQPEKK
ncbi:MAG TPA: hypothetical protein VMR25_07550 [Planctomycetaceae bacterium]|jgi:hypothetical protein|nr:hypothetical protein [Planctomycetaceae bacterium]